MGLGKDSFGLRKTRKDFLRHHFYRRLRRGRLSTLGIIGWLAFIFLQGSAGGRRVPNAIDL